jgi:leader peptidase (prepilin peptidase)/N-methyltransferase
VETLGGVLAVGCFFYYGDVGKTLCVFAFAMALIVIALVDYDTMEIYDVMNVIVFIIGCISGLFFTEVSMMERDGRTHC